MAVKAEQKSRASGETAKASKSASSASRTSRAHRKQSRNAATSVAQVRLRPDELAELEQVMQTLDLHSLSDALREGLRLLSREATEVAAAQEIRDFYQEGRAPTPAGVLPVTADELAATDEIEW
ncbi:hypothetical protein GCM10009716_38750 [Streptomyces sodiiphilus]|uniref:Ribbon-helix-helix protein CopG domain-containing protein n=1 Tax=Streptomyces sodiiphilus TaxID=226217 RepID=A0ABN2PQ85_9ACTN